MSAALASPEGLKNRRTVAKQVAPAKTDSLGMSEKLRKTPKNTGNDASGFLPDPAQKTLLRQAVIQKQLGLGRSLGFTHALLQALCAAMTATIQFFLTFDFLVSHNSLRGKPH